MSFELFYRDLVKLNVPLTSGDQDRLRNQLKNISYNYIYSYDFSKQKNILSKGEWKALNDLRSDDSIIITKPDKVNGSVIVSRLDYLNKMKQLLSDNTKFKPLTNNPTKAREDSFSSYLRKLRKDGIIDDTQARREGGCDGCARTPPHTAEVHFFVKKINSKKKIIVLFRLFCSNSLIA